MCFTFLDRAFCCPLEQNLCLGQPTDWYAVVRYLSRTWICVFVVFAAVSVLDVAGLDHEVDEVLDAEDLVVLDWVLLVDGLDEEPVLVDDVEVVGVEPEVRALHEALEELLLELRVTDEESNVCQVRNCLVVH